MMAKKELETIAKDIKADLIDNILTVMGDLSDAAFESLDFDEKSLKKMSIDELQKVEDFVLDKYDEEEDD